MGGLQPESVSPLLQGLSSRNLMRADRYEEAYQFSRYASLGKGYSGFRDRIAYSGGESIKSM
jgi:hypothetical protein